MLKEIDCPKRMVPKGYGPKGMVQRVWSKGYGPKGMVQRVWSQKGMVQRVWSKGYDPKGMVQRVWSKRVWSKRVWSKRVWSKRVWLTLLTIRAKVASASSELPFTLLKLRMLSLVVPGQMSTSDKLATTVAHSTVLVKITTFSLVCFGSKLGVCTHSINIVFTDGIVNCLLELLLLLLCHSLLNSNCIPGNNHFLRFLFLLLLQLSFLRYAWAGKTETLANIVPAIIRLLLLGLFLNWIFVIVPVLKFQIPLKFEFFAVASNIHLQ